MNRDYARKMLRRLNTFDTLVVLALFLALLAFGLLRQEPGEVLFQGTLIPRAYMPPM